MGKIQKLPESLIRLIAAGEVIERPASVLKELVENSLDAGATRVEVDLWGAGRSRIRVSDNGEGMSREDAEAAFERHATSKLRSFDDLHRLVTFGFRGEALPSIAAVSRLVLSTRQAAEPQGWRLQLEGGVLHSVAPVAGPAGTIVDVQDLFFNTPARDKFLKRDSTERSHLMRALQDIALAHPHVGFEARLDDRAALHLAPGRDLKQRVTDLWGPAVAQPLVPLECTEGPVTIRGFINAVPGHHPTRTYQALFINDRPVQQRTVSHAIYEAYHEWLPVGRHPVFVLFIDIDPELVDVNVHPAKREVRCSNEAALHALLFDRIRALLSGRQDVPRVESRRPFIGDRPRPGPGVVANALSAQEPLVMDRAPAELPLAGLAAPATVPARLDPEAIRILGVFHRLYLLAEQDDELLLVDQHAAAERVMYERLLRQAREPAAARQPLLTPFVWTLTPAQVQIVEEARPALDRLGFILEPFGGTAFALKEWPAPLGAFRQARQFLEVLIDSLEEESQGGQALAHHDTVARAACRAAIKANDPLSPLEARRLLQDLAACERPMTCPHGRPTFIRMPAAELDRRFKRT